MGMFDSIKDQAANLAGEHADKLGGLADQAAAKAGDAIDSATGGKFTEQIDGLEAQAGDRLQDALGGGADAAAEAPAAE